MWRREGGGRCGGTTQAGSQPEASVVCTCNRTKCKILVPFLTGRIFVREPCWKYSANIDGS